ncbi:MULTISPECIES: sulfite exporter TauE/SafE family protein [Mammaliicoccus]|uniref:sulfite exporter TauE/SafE family protein n=1 Tax=Mammaliicoccus TaxID=2803850 RepID=UPI00099263F6|nr:MULTISPECIES: sulfite exporter TauE/SafE family protein [Mammaliicoccus]MBO3061470.1 sulfite exporter TauE/SafE family protein [Mammaliicoccus fleurettii]MDT3995590.1 sulfite exporter TauE/SafE family protein [Mammaliicoccus fleurettii]MEB7724160.1 sulfite exporter TauE/SafE family protein [Mammaliicoccus fleurettii]MEB7779888.1 sulfite exporter TauE/SafE family protein [Mammaliicoccus fleurettii]MEB8068525.1 sulfite exporter TauE/SafE family protein [Mammaliicoccus fleurettii]
MRKLTIFAIVGFLAQLIDGSLGMGFGATSSSLLLTFGVAPAIASATIHFSEVATTAASGISHLKFKNVDKSIILKLALPGAITGFIGAGVLSNLHSDFIKPFIAIFLLSMGVYIIYQFVFKKQQNNKLNGGKLSGFILVPQGAVAGFLDAIGGGGWGPVNTPLLLSRNQIEPRYVIGTVSASEFFVTISTSLGFIIFLGWSQISILLVVALAFGGVVAAPFSAWLVKTLPVYVLAVLVGGLIIFTNSSVLLGSFVSNETTVYIVKIGIVVAWLGLVLFTLYQHNKFPFNIQNQKSKEVDQIN